MTSSHLISPSPFGVYPSVCVCVHRYNKRFRSVYRACMILMKQGDHQCAACDGPTKRPQSMRISRLITVTYLPTIEMYWTVEQTVLFRLFKYFSTVWNFDFPEVTAAASNVTFSTCLRWQVTQHIRRPRWHHSQFPLIITPQCVMGVGPDLVTPSVGFDQSESHERAFSRIQSGEWISEAACTQSAFQVS